MKESLKGKELKFDDIDLQEKFYEKYGYEPDEQNIENSYEKFERYEKK